MRRALFIAALAASACGTRHSPWFTPSPADRAPSPEATSCPEGVCDDGNRCTVDTCDAGVCSHVPLVCPAPADPCRVAVCDLVIGCALTAVDDGTECGPSSCVDETVSSCFGGACVTQQVFGPVLACGDTWSRGYLDEQTGPAFAFDEKRGRLVLFTQNSSFANQTWEFDGIGWTQQTPIGSPTQAFAATMAYDRLRDRTVMFAGWDPIETWEWDGAQWKLLAPQTQPAKREGESIFYDTVRQRVVVYGGAECPYGGCAVYSDFWEWDGSNWSALPVTPGPPDRWNTMTAWDEARGRLVLFGGEPFNAQGVLGDTWEWDGAAWQQRTPAHSPPARSSGALTYDRLRQRTVLRGGVDAQFIPTTDLWEWDGNDWQQIAFDGGPGFQSGDSALSVFFYDPVAGKVTLLSTQSADLSSSGTWRWDGVSWTESGPELPVGRAYASLVYDPKREQVVLFGGRNGASCCLPPSELGDSWTWDGHRWSKVPGAVPPARERASMVFDGVREQVLLFGGTADRHSAFGDTWSFDGTRWTQLFPRRSPPARFGAAIGYDNRRQRVVLFGGVSTLGGILGDTWEWDGSEWTEVLHGAFAPPSRCCGRMAYDGLHQQMVLMGGTTFFDEQGFTFPLEDTWNFDGKKWVPKASTTSFIQPRQDYGMAYDSKRQRVTVFGGFGQAGSFGLSDTLVWDGAQWLNRWPIVAPSGLGGFEMAYDAKRDQMVIFGGAPASDSRGTTNTWLYGGPP